MDSGPATLIITVNQNCIIGPACTQACICVSSMCVCMHVCMHVCTHACMRACMHACRHACASNKRECVRLASPSASASSSSAAAAAGASFITIAGTTLPSCTPVYVCAYICVSFYAEIRTYTRMPVYVCACISVSIYGSIDRSIYLSIYLYAYTRTQITPHPTRPPHRHTRQTNI